MIIDAQLLFSDAQNIGTASANASTNYIDLSVVGGRDVGTGKTLQVFCIVDTAFVSVSAASSVTVDLEGNSSTTFTPDATQTLFTIPAAAAAGTRYYSKLDPKAGPLQYRYNRLKYTPSGAGLSDGAVTAGIIVDGDAQSYYASGYSILNP